MADQATSAADATNSAGGAPTVGDTQPAAAATTAQAGDGAIPHAPAATTAQAGDEATSRTAAATPTAQAGDEATPRTAVATAAAGGTAAHEPDTSAPAASGAEAAPAPQEAVQAEPDRADKPGFGVRGRMRRRVRFLRKARELGYRDLGGLVYEMQRLGERHDELVAGKLATLGAIDGELRALEGALGERQPVTVLREAGIAACPRCAAIHGSEDRYCPACGLAMGQHADRPIAGPAAATTAATATMPVAPVAAMPTSAATASPPGVASPATSAAVGAGSATRWPAPVAGPTSAPTPATAAPGPAGPYSAPTPAPATSGPGPSPAPTPAPAAPPLPAPDPRTTTDQPTEIIRPSDPAAGEPG